MPMLFSARLGRMALGPGEHTKVAKKHKHKDDSEDEEDEAMVE